MTEIPALAFARILCLSAKHPRKQSVAGVLVRDHASGEWNPRADNMSEVLEYLDGDEILKRREGQIQTRFPFRKLSSGTDGAVERVDLRRHVELECNLPICRFKVSARGEVLDAILDELWAKGWANGLVGDDPGDRVLPVPLAFLAASL